MDNQLNMYEFISPKYKITKPIRLIEFFAGYGSQALALKYLGINFQHWKICEWAIKSIQAYKDIHHEFDETYPPILESQTREKMVDYLYNKGISSNYNEPMTKQQIERLSEEQLRNILNNIYQTHNLVNIQQVKGKDLEIVDTDKYDYILTYSFPCQDLSLAGKGKGMSDTSTRSGMLWEVERILDECKELGTLPQILLMENVPQVHGADNVKDFNKWQLKLQELGYSSYWEDLIATDYGIPQTRNRCFMVSILGDYSYTFPQPIPLKLKLKDMLEDNVDEKYYLSDKMIKYISADNEKWTGNNGESLINKTYASTLNTREGMRRCDSSNYISNQVEENYNLKNIHKTSRETLETNDIKEGVNYIDAYNRKIDNTGLSKTISTRVDASNNTYIAIKNATKKGYLEATDGDGIDISSRMEHHRGTVQKDKSQTITTSGGNDRGVVVADTLKRDLCNKLIQDGLVEEGDVVKHSYTQQIMDGNKKCVEKNDGSMITLTTKGDCIGVCVNDKPQVLGGLGKKKSNGGTQWYQQDGVYDDNVAISVTTSFNPYYKDNLRIRKLTPRECFRLMGVKDEDFDRVKVNQSDASLYHLAGDSIVVNVLIAIFKELI